MKHRPKSGLAVWLPAFLFLMTLSSQIVLARPDPAKPNHLAGESSLYLLEHADNPVDWYPWGEEAFDKARRENKPILLSIGYSTCLYCHVMERESYSDETIASILNERFVAIKVDREQRPDIDETFILATQFFAGASGWPNNVFLTPDLKPFYGGLYFPPAEFLDVLSQISVAWHESRDALISEADQAADLIHQVMRHRLAAQTISPAALNNAARSLLADFDEQNGGFGTGPRFTHETLLLLLLDRAELFDDSQALNAATKTLDAMIKGGVRDHVGGGIHRYSVDPEWRVPNLEIMLFNQAGIARALLQAYRITGRQRYADAVRQLLDFIIRDMTSPDGAFYTSLDPELAGDGTVSPDGLHYTWTDEAFESALEPAEYAFVSNVFDLTPMEAFADRKVLSMKGSIEDLASRPDLTVAQVRDRLAKIREKLRSARNKRPAPRRDEKILSSWNGMMILAFAEAAILFDDPQFRDAATNAAEFIWSKMDGETGTLKRSYFAGKAEIDATQQDYVFVALGYLALYDSTENAVWLDRAKTLAQTMNEQFFDEQMNDYFINRAGSFYRPKMIADTEQPSGNAAAVELFARLMRRDDNPDHRAMAERIVASMSGNILDSPRQNIYALRAATQLVRNETGPVRMAARGRIRIVANQADEKTVRVKITIAPGWHVNSDQPLEDFFIPTKLSFPGNPKTSNTNIQYPEPTTLALRFHNKSLSLFQDQIEIVAKPSDPDFVPKVAELTVQACSDSICLEPETLQVPILN